MWIEISFFLICIYNCVGSVAITWTLDSDMLSSVQPWPNCPSMILACQTPIYNTPT